MEIAFLMVQIIFSRKDESRIYYAFHPVIKYFKLATNEIVRV